MAITTQKAGTAIELFSLIALPALIAFLLWATKKSEPAGVEYEEEVK